jgi:quinol-cytochrome oxidoreductase complex cytochrome b subunit
MTAEATGATSTMTPDDAPLPGDERMWTARLRGWAVRALPPGKLLPDRQPSYVASWVYVFGVLTLAAFVVILVTGVVLVWRGPSWWHLSKLGLFFNSMHLWSVELFFFFMVLHLWGKFFMAAWRGKRTLTWMTGVVSFLVSIGAAFTGYLSQQNFDSQWISTQAKDGLNSVGVGAFFNVLNFGQMLLWHVLLLPVVVAVIVGLHLLMVRHRGVVRPMARKGDPKDALEAPGPGADAAPAPPADDKEPVLAGAAAGSPPTPASPAATGAAPGPEASP